MKSLCDGRYKIEQEIGHGGFGNVYKAWDSKVDVYVAIKEIICRSEKELDNVIQEAKIAAGFYDLENITSARDYFTDRDKTYIVYEYVSGNSIKEYIAKHGRMKGEEVLEKIKPVIKSLIKIHKRNIIHRDISADNIMITKSGELMLIDFGSAKKIENIASETNTIIFKRGFAPIELYRESSPRGTWTDVYSVCATIYFMVSGIIPEESIERIFDDKLTDLENVWGTGLSDSQKKIIMAGLKIEPEERLQSLDELYKELYHVSPDSGEVFPEIKTVSNETHMSDYTKNIKNEIDDFFAEKHKKKFFIIPTVLLISLFLFVYLMNFIKVKGYDDETLNIKATPTAGLPSDGISNITTNNDIESESGTDKENINKSANTTENTDQSANSAENTDQNKSVVDDNKSNNKKNTKNTKNKKNTKKAKQTSNPEKKDSDKSKSKKDNVEFDGSLW